MAVDYTVLDTYKDTRNTYKDSLKSAEDADNQSMVSTTLAYASTGASLFGGFGGGWGALIGGLVGGGIGALQALIAPTTIKRDELYATIRQKNNTYYNSALQTQTKRNDIITQAQYYVNKTRGTFESTYGKESLSMLESTISTLLNMGSTEDGNFRMSEILGGLQRDTIVGDIMTRLYTTNLKDKEYNDKGEVVSEKDLGGVMSEQQWQELSSQYLNLEQLGQYYISNLYESIVKSDTAFGEAAEQLSKSEKYASEKYELNLESTMANNANKFAELFLNMRNQNISNAQTMGKSEAESGASGIKASRSSRTSNQVAKLNQDIANASYAILYDQYRKQLSAEIKNGILTREQVGYQYASQREQLYRQIKESYQSSLNSWWEDTTKYATTIGNAETETDNYIAGAKAGEAFLAENNKSYDDQKRYIYSTGSATV